MRESDQRSILGRGRNGPELVAGGYERQPRRSHHRRVRLVPVFHRLRDILQHHNHERVLPGMKFLIHNFQNTKILTTISGGVAVGHLPVQHVQRRALRHFHLAARRVSANRAEDAEPLR